MHAPIVLFVYNRIEHVKRLIDSLKENELSSQSDLFIFCDGYKNENDKNDVLRVREYAKSIASAAFFEKVIIKEAAENKGLAKSIITGITEIINQYGRAIVLEDDLIVSPYFLKYMNKALDFYENEQRVWSISGFTREIPYLKDIEADVYFACRAQSWGWGTWKNRWEATDWDVSDYADFKKDFRCRKAFNSGGDDMASMLDRQQCGKINSWAIRWCYAQYKNDGYTLQPTETLVQNTGQDGSGTNCRYVREFSAMSSKTEWNFRHFESDKEVNKKLKETRKKIPKWKLACSYFFYVLCKGKIRI